MRKFRGASLILAGLGGFAVSVTAAETEWDWYGQIRVGVGLFDDGNDSDLNFFDRGSFIGIRGSRSLGTGAEIYGQLESLVRFDQGAGVWASRDSFVGIRNQWGSLQGGHFSPPVRNIGRRADLIWSRTGDNRTLTRTDNIDGFWRGRQPGWDNRWGNSIAYYSPSMAGMSLALVYSTDPAGGQSGDSPHAINGAVSFERGPLWAAVGYEALDEGSVAGTEAPSLVRAGASYKIGALTFSGLFNSARDQKGDGNNNRDIWGVGTAYALSDKWSGAVQYYEAGDNDAQNDTGARMIAGEVVNRIDKKTRLYFAVARTDNDDNARFDSSRGVVPQLPLGRTSTSSSVTFRYSF